MDDTVGDDPLLPCVECGEPVETSWAKESGGLCVDCLVGYAMPLTRIVPRS